MSLKRGSMRYERISCGWSKRLKPTETSRIFIRTACDHRRNEMSALIASASVINEAEV
jgi:hypothetical protein